SQGFPLGFIRQDLMFSGDTIYERIHKKDATEGDYLQKLPKELEGIHKRSSADITKQINWRLRGINRNGNNCLPKETIKCICLYDLNHDGVIDLSDFALLDISHVQELAEFGRVYGRRAEYEFWR
ncbi:MAG: hypothetical protein ACTSQ8_26655, partial [Candidatus Helarchaeota archaeon]